MELGRSAILVLERTWRPSNPAHATRSGDIRIRAPEQLDGSKLIPDADVYAFGKILVFLLSGQTDVDRIQLPRCAI